MKKGKEDTENGEVTNRAVDETIPFHKLFKFADPIDTVLMVVGSVSGFVNGISMPMMTIIFGQLINSFGRSSPDEVVHLVSKVIIKFVYLASVSAVVAFLQVACWTIAGERQATRIRYLYLERVLRQDIAFFDTETSTGEIIERLTGDTIHIQDAMGEKVGKFIQLVSTFIGGFVVAFIKGYLLALVMLSCIPLLVIAGALMSVIIVRSTGRGQRAYAEAGKVVDETIGSIRTVASFGGERKAISNYVKALKDAYHSTFYQGLAAGFGIGIFLWIIFSCYGMAVWYGAKLIIKKGYDGGTVITVITAVMTGGMSLGQTSPCMTAFSSGRAAAYKVFETIHRKPDIDVYDNSGTTLKDMKGDIELRNVYFHYPSRPEVQVFAGFSLNVPCGTTAALVGESGSGKSTVVSLLQRFYDPISGEVLIDGVDMKKLKLKWIREKIGLVSQEPVLFTTTIKENIAYGKEGATVEEIQTATELANAAKFIDKMPQGLDTMVGEHGVQLSGGQKQRIAIARAILKNPRILLLDEATSALDAESERVVQDALVRIMMNRTTVVVAHRLTTVRNADMIAVVHRGKIVEQGSHSELTKDPNGSYSQLIRLQESTQQEEPVESDPDKLICQIVNPSKASGKSGSQRFSLMRSMSKGSSLGGSSRHSFSISFRLANAMPGTVSIQDGSHLGDSNIQREDRFDCEDNKRISFQRVLRLNKPDLLVLLLGTICGATQGVIFPIFGILLSSAIKIFYEPPHQLTKDSRFWSLMYVSLGAIAVITSSSQSHFFTVASLRLIRRIRCLTFERIVHQEISWFDQPMNSSGSVSARLSGDAMAVKCLVGDTLALNVQNISTVIAGIIISMVANWRLALIILVLVPLIGLEGYAQIKFMRGSSADAKAKYEEASQIANNAVGSIRTVASFCAEQKIIDLYKSKCDDPMKDGVKQGVVSGLGYGFSYFALFTTYALCFYSGARLVQCRKATFSQVFKVFYALTMAATVVSQTSAFAPDLNKAKQATISIFSLLDRKSKIDSSKEEGITLSTLKGDIEFQHVSFKYPTRPDVVVFRDLNLSIPSGKTVALVGESGSGKSTVISLLQRFYDPDGGRILLDGVEIQKIKLKWLRRQMGLVSQEPVLFNDTIRANITYGKEGNVTEEEMIAAAEASNAHRFIAGLPEGYNTCVGERGVQLSGGQKQRIAIARAIIRNPKILLLDEATSALDAESERIVQDALDRVMVNRTTVIVAHRLSTIKGADVIAVVKNGVIAEKGRHDILIKVTDGLYAALISLHMGSVK